MTSSYILFDNVYTGELFEAYSQLKNREDELTLLKVSSNIALENFRPCSKCQLLNTLSL